MLLPLALSFLRAARCAAGDVVDETGAGTILEGIVRGRLCRQVRTPLWFSRSLIFSVRVEVWLGAMAGEVIVDNRVCQDSRAGGLQRETYGCERVRLVMLAGLQQRQDAEVQETPRWW